MNNSFSNHKFVVSPESESKDYIKNKLNMNPFQNIHPSDTKKLGAPSIAFSLTTSFPHVVYNKYKILYPKDYIFDLEKALSGSGKGLFGGSLSNDYNPPDFKTMWEAQYKSTTVPSKGLIIPDTTENHSMHLMGQDMSLLLDFVNISDTEGMLSWVTKYGPLDTYFSEKYLNAQDIGTFVNELSILKTLYCLFTAVNCYAENNKQPLNSRIKILKLAEYAEKLEPKLGNTLLDAVYFWGYDFSSTYNIKLDRLQIDKLKKENGYILLLDDLPTPISFKQPNLTDDTLPLKAMEFISHMINYKTCYEGANGVLVNRYSLSCSGIQNNTLNAPSIYRLLPSISCDNYLVLMYFQLLWLISTDGAKACKKCGQYFPPKGDRPGKRKYCGSCGNHAAQDQYKKRTLAAIKAYKSGISLEQAASENNITIKRLAKALEAGV